MEQYFSHTGDRIRFLMELNDMKQINICRCTGISKNAVCNYINGNRVPDTIALFKLAELFSVSIEWLLTGRNLSGKMMINKSKINGK